MSDAYIAFEMALMAAGYKPIKKEPLDPIFQALLDYVNSPEYQKLILKEWDEKKKNELTKNQ